MAHTFSTDRDPALFLERTVNGKPERLPAGSPVMVRDAVSGAALAGTETLPLGYLDFEAAVRSVEVSGDGGTTWKGPFWSVERRREVNEGESRKLEDLLDMSEGKFKPTYMPDLSGTYARTQGRPVNLRDRVGSATSEPADSIVAQALTDGPVEWPADLTLTLTDPAGVTIGQGQSLTAHDGAQALVQHAGAGFRVAGTLEGLAIDYQGGGSIEDVAVWVIPDSDHAIVRGTRVTGGSACYAAGGAESTPGDATDAIFENTYAYTAVPGSYAYRLDESAAVTLTNAVGTGAALDIVKLRRKVRRLRIIGGRFTGAQGGDGLDGFAGAVECYIGGGALFHDNAYNGLVFKTDNDNDTDDPMGLSDWIEAYGLPKRQVIDGVMALGNGGSGLSLHRTDAADSDVGNGIDVPWLRQVLVANAVAADNAGAGLFLNLQAAHLSGVMVARNASTGVRVHKNSRDVTASGVHAIANGAAGQPIDNFHLEGRRIWLSQCMAYGVDPDAVDDADLAAATKITRFGYRIPTGADVHLTQCGSYYHATANLSDSDGNTSLVDCDMGIPSSSGVLLSSDSVFGFRDGQSYRRAMFVGAVGANPAVVLGDTGGSGWASMTLGVRPGGTVISSGHLSPQANGVYDLGANATRWRNAYFSGVVNLNGLWLRNNNGVLEKSTDFSTWTPVA